MFGLMFLDMKDIFFLLTSLSFMATCLAWLFNVFIIGIIIIIIVKAMHHTFAFYLFMITHQIVVMLVVICFLLNSDLVSSIINNLLVILLFLLYELCLSPIIRPLTFIKYGTNVCVIRDYMRLALLQR